jgi:hypothetical protein
MSKTLSAKEGSALAGLAFEKERLNRTQGSPELVKQLESADAKTIAKAIFDESSVSDEEAKRAARQLKAWSQGRSAPRNP